MIGIFKTRLTTSIEHAHPLAACLVDVISIVRDFQPLLHKLRSNFWVSGSKVFIFFKGTIVLRFLVGATSNCLLEGCEAVQTGS